MATTKRAQTTTPEGSGSTDRSPFERLEGLLDEWRVRIDELMVQADLASKDISEAVRAKATVAENAYLAAASRLREMPRDAGSNLSSMLAGFDKLIDDMHEAYQSAEAVIRRDQSD